MSDARPAYGVIGFGYVIEYGVAGILSRFTVFIAGENRADGLVYVVTREECKLGGVKDVVCEKC